MSLAMSKTLVVIATYNEIENLPRLVDSIFTVLPEAHVLVIDDNSPDGTGTWCLDRKSRDSRFDCVIRSGKLGLGTAVQAGMQFAMTNEYDFLINMDADFSHPPEKLPELLAAMEAGENSCEPDQRNVAETPHLMHGLRQIDVAIGSRYVPSGKIKGWPLSRRLMSRAVNFYARICLGLRTRDNSGAYRCYRVATLQRILADRISRGEIRSKGYSFFEEILFLLRRGGAEMVEIPITFTDRKFGKSKINLREAVKAIGIIFLLGLTRWRNR